MDFHPELTVLIAPNGEGKTTLLDAARVALWPFVKGFDLGSQTGKAASIHPLDVRLVKQASGNMEPQLPSRVLPLKLALHHPRSHLSEFACNGW